MHLEELVLDGFKAYARRTVVSGFDKQFNAITGLNGSGKSSIADALMWLFGARLDLLRVQNPTELIYKNGQAGITKATVSAVFNNEDEGQSPVGYEQYDKVTVTRQVWSGVCAAVTQSKYPARCAGCRRRPHQILDQWTQCDIHPSSKLFPLGAAECHQPAFLHHAGVCCMAFPTACRRHSLIPHRRGVSQKCST